LLDNFNNNYFKIVFLFRKSFSGSFSIEKIFTDISKNLPRNFIVKSRVNKYFSNQYFHILYDICSVFFIKSDIFHVTGDTNYITYFLNKRKTILTIHDCINLESSSGFKFFIFYIFWYWIPIKKSKYITFVSHETKNNVLKYFKINDTKIRIIYNHLPEGYTKFPKDFNKELPNILMIGSAPNKNITNQIKALIGIKVHLTIIGIIPNDTIKLLKNNNINYHNYYNLTDQEIINEFKKSDILLFASTYEGFGLPIIQSQAIGRPVITSNISSMPEIAGKGACLVNPFNIQDINFKLLKCINDENYRGYLINEGFNNIERFTLDKTMIEYKNLYNEMFIK
jgi:glycosyltransferase involved in cell wall biosynthesis